MYILEDYIYFILLGKYTLQEFMGFRTLSGVHDDNILETRVVFRR